MKRRVIPVLLLLVLLMQVCPASGAESEILLPVTFANILDADPLHYEVSYQEHVFSGDPKIYNHTLARMSLGMALSAFHSYEESKVPEENIIRFLTEAGFSNLRSEEYEDLTSSDSIGSMIGCKKMGDRTLVAVALRGGGYQGEWVGNMEVGSPEDPQIFRHAGFQRAMKKAAERVRRYVSSLEGPVTFWIAGYSRAAAVSNLLAAELLDTGVADQEHLFAYTFATPAGSRTGNETEERYRGIWNIIKAFDPVPRVPLQEWGFTRYGQTRILTCQEADADFDRLRDRAVEWVKEHFGTDWLSNSYINYVLRMLLQTLYTMVPDAEEYVRDYQETIQKAFRESNDILAVLEEVFKLYNAQAENPSMISMSEFVTEQAWQGLLQWAGKGNIDLNNQMDIFSNLVWEHLPEAYVGLMMSSGEELYDFPRTYWHICIFDETQGEIYGWKNNSDNARDAGEIYAVLNAHGTDGTWPCVVLSGGAIVALPTERDYALFLSGPEGMESSVIIRRYTLGELETENFVSDPLKMRDGITTWVMLTGDQAEINYGESTNVFSDIMAREMEEDSGAAGDLEILSRGSGTGLVTIAVILGLLTLGLVITLVLSIRAYIRGERKKTSVLLLVLIGILFAFTMLCDNFLPAHERLRTVLTGLTTATCLLECLICSLEKGNRRNYFMLLGFLFYLANDVVIDWYYDAGVILSMVGILFFCMAYWPESRPGWKEMGIWAVLSAGLGALAWVLRDSLGGSVWLMPIYGMMLIAMQVLAWKQGGLIRIGSVLYTMSAFVMVYIQTGADFWWTWLICMGLYYISICVTALGAKGGQNLSQTEKKYVPKMRHASFVFSVGLTALLFIAEQYVVNFLQPGTIRFVLAMILKGFSGTICFLLCVPSAWRIRKGWIFFIAGGVMLAAAGNVFLFTSMLRGVICYELSALLFTAAFYQLHRPDGKERILAAVVCGTVGIGMILAAVRGQMLPPGKGWMIPCSGLAFLTLLSALRQQSWLRIGGALFALATLGLIITRNLQMETGVVCGMVQAAYYAALLSLTGGCRLIARRETRITEQDRAEEEKQE